eukprot:CAMPEP_0197465554 /NCGR_PEP_ID=MMETSP1175-20131217/64599_1 /TAXON_ID=1003142 /ORGANISM="Triceratium dubium, Strain CCMP147" /LENGTH=227 /DNA_ID=CAMNT_0043001573 /DNA_START=414 /DNA_END=1097 /DNA_ORIENTATION=-
MPPIGSPSVLDGENFRPSALVGEDFRPPSSQKPTPQPPTTNPEPPTPSPHTPEQPTRESPTTDSSESEPPPCENDSHCSNGVCAYKEYGEWDKVCCSSGESVSYSVWSYCTDQLAGKACGGNEMCRSGVCTQNVCREDTQDANANCENDADCSNGVCAYVDISSWDRVCCASGEEINLGGLAYCTGQPTGNWCGSDAMCQSNVCIDSTCRDGQVRQLALRTRCADCP